VGEREASGAAVEVLMAVLRAKQRRRLKKSSFGLPGQRKYPMHDRRHAANAKSRATQQFRKGRLSRAQYNTIIRKANKKLRGGKRKVAKRRRRR
jgi:hypothetical protein